MLHCEMGFRFQNGHAGWCRAFKKSRISLWDLPYMTSFSRERRRWRSHRAILRCQHARVWQVGYGWQRLLCRGFQTERGPGFSRHTPPSLCRFRNIERKSLSTSNQMKQEKLWNNLLFYGLISPGIFRLQSHFLSLNVVSKHISLFSPMFKSCTVLQMVGR